MRLVVPMTVTTLLALSVGLLPAEANETASSSAATAQAGLEFANSQTRNTGAVPVEVVTRTELAGTCVGSTFQPTRQLSPGQKVIPLVPATGAAQPTAPGQLTFGQLTFPNPAQLSLPTVTSTSTREGEIQSWFVSSTTPPASGLRVVIRNVTPGIEGETAPYSDREYSDGSRSEGFIARFGKRHDRKYLAVKEGANRFTYEIKRGNSVVESGSFTSQIDRQTKAINESVDPFKKCQAQEETNRRIIQNLPDQSLERKIRELQSKPPTILLRPTAPINFQRPNLQLQIPNFQSQTVADPETDYPKSSTLVKAVITVIAGAQFRSVTEACPDCTSVSFEPTLRDRTNHHTKSAAAYKEGKASSINSFDAEFHKIALYSSRSILLSGSVGLPSKRLNLVEG